MSQNRREAVWWQALEAALQQKGLRILGHAGSGGMGHVVKAWDARFEIVRALKFLPPLREEDSPAGHRLSSMLRERFHQEARIGMMLSGHENVMRCLEKGSLEVEFPDAGGGTRTELVEFLNLEWLEGTALLERLQREGRRMPLELAVRFVQQAARGVASLHEQDVVHRDLKPSNFHLVDGREGSSGWVKITDFGIARKLGGDYPSPQLTWFQGAGPGTEAYMSPEQLRGWEAEPSSDLFSLGLVAFEVLSGVRPFSREERLRMSYGEAIPPPHLPPGVPTALAKGLHRVLSPWPQSRGTAQDLIADAADAFNSPGVSYKPVPDPPTEAALRLPPEQEPTRTELSGRARPIARRSQFPWAYGLAIGLPVLVGALFLTLRGVLAEKDLPVTMLADHIRVSGARCVDLAPLFYDDAALSATEYLRNELQRALRDRDPVPDVRFPAPPDSECSSRITGEIVRHTPGESAPFVGELRLERRVGPDWMRVAGIQVGDGVPRGTPGSVRVEHSMDSTQWYFRHQGEMRNATGATRGSDSCGEISEPSYIASALRSAAREIVRREGVESRIVVTRRIVREEWHNHFSAELTYFISPKGIPASRLEPPCSSSGTL